MSSLLSRISYDNLKFNEMLSNFHGDSVWNSHASDMPRSLETRWKKG